MTVSAINKDNIKQYGIPGLFIAPGSILLPYYSKVGLVLICTGVLIGVIQIILKIQRRKVNFHEALHRIRDLLERNKAVFKQFYPNTTAGNIDILNFELTLWENAKTQIIVPNNKIICELLDKIAHVFSSDELCIVQKMRTHVFAFQNHVTNPKVDYSAHTFPSEFVDLINRKLYGIQNSVKLAEKYIKWLIDCNSNKFFNEVYLFGSVLFSGKPIDVDILVKYDSKPEFFVSEANRISKEFEKEFGLKLHITAFSQSEQELFMKFRDKYSNMVKLNSGEL